MNIKQIKYFVAAAQHKSLSAAAKNQYVTVQAVSKAIADLEHELGSSLFVRESRGVKLTPFGSRFVQKAEKVLEEFAELEAFAQGSAAKKARPPLDLMLCVPAFYTTEKACRSIKRFLEKHLNVEASVVLGNSHACHQALEQNSIDAFISVGAVAEAGIECMPVGTVCPGVIMLRNHPYVKKDAISLEDMKKYPFNVSRKFDYFYEAVTKGFEGNPDFPPIEPADENTKSMLAFFLRGGMTACPCIASLGELFPGTVMRPFAPEHSLAIPICLNFAAGHKSEPLASLEHLLCNDLFLFGFGNGAD